MESVTAEFSPRSRDSAECCLWSSSWILPVTLGAGDDHGPHFQVEKEKLRFRNLNEFPRLGGPWDFNPDPLLLPTVLPCVPGLGCPLLSNVHELTSFPLSQMSIPYHRVLRAVVPARHTGLVVHGNAHVEVSGGHGQVQGRGGVSEGRMKVLKGDFQLTTWRRGEEYFGLEWHSQR